MPSIRTWWAVAVCIVLATGSQVPAGDKVAARTDCFGDPLPPGVLARLGTERFSHCHCAAISPDGKIVATGEYQDIYLWDSDTGRELRRLSFPGAYGVSGLVFSSDSKQLAVLDFSGTTIQLWDLKTFQLKTLPQKDFGGRDDDWNAAAVFSRDGKALFAATASSLFHWDTSSGKKLKQVSFQLDGRPCRNSYVVFSPDGKTIATEADDKVYLWNVQTGAFQRQIKGIKGYRPLRFSPDGKIIASGYHKDNQNPRIDLWEAATGQKVQSFEVKGWVKFLAFSPDGKTLASAQDVWDDDQSIQLIDLTRPKKAAKIVPAPGIGSVQFSPDGKTIAWRCGYTTLRFLDLATGKELHQFPSHRGKVRSVVFSRNGNTIASGSEDGTARLWDAVSGKQLRAFHGHQMSVNSVALSPDGKLLVSASSDRTALVWDLITGKKKATLEGHGNQVLAAAFSPDGEILATGGGGPCLLWHPFSGKKIHQGAFPGGSLAFTPDGKVLAAATEAHSDAGLVFLLDVSKKTFRKITFGKYITSLAYSPDGKTLAVGCEDHLFVVDATTGQTKKTLPGHWNWRGSVAFSPDGRYLASGGDGMGRGNPHKTTQIFELLTGTEIYSFKKGPVVYSVAFSPDGMKLAIGRADATVLIWDLKNLSGKKRRASLSPRVLTDCWQALAKAEAKDFYEAKVDLLHAPQSAVPYLAERLQPAPALNYKQVEQWIVDLGHAQFKRRETARRELEKLAELVEEPLRQALSGKPPLESQRRLEGLLAKLDRISSPARLRELRAIEILEWIGTPQAGKLLKRLAQGNPAGQITREAQAALARRKK